MPTKSATILLSVLFIVLNTSCNNTQNNDSGKENKPETTDKIETSPNKNVLTEDEKYIFYKLPNDIEEKMKKGEEFKLDDLEKFKVDEKSLVKSNGNVDCVVHGNSTIKCTCKAPDGTITYKDGKCDIYYANEGGKWVYCYTRCESCINVCH